MKLYFCSNSISNLPYRHTRDVTHSIKYTQGLKVTSGGQVSTKTGMSASLELAVKYGVFSGSLSTTLTSEVERIQTQGSESSWSKEVNASIGGRSTCFDEN